MTEHPLAKLWPAVAADLEQRMPETIVLPREEIIRLCNTMYFLGMANAMMGMTTLEMMTDDDPNKDQIRAVYYAQTAELVKANRTTTFEQMLATIQAHGATEMTKIVKVQRPLMSNIDISHGPALVYAKGRKNVCTIDLTDELRTAMGDDPKAYFNATWTGKTWVIKDRVPDQAW